jgi:tetratricopeptide (TPR) repeat protein
MAFTQDSLSHADLEKALAKFDAGKFKAALKFYDADLLYSEVEYIFFADCANMIRDFKTEHEILSLGLERNNQSGMLYERRGKFFERMREYDRAIRELTLAMKYPDNDSLRKEYTVTRGWQKFLKNDLEGCVEDCESIIQEDSMHIFAMNTLGLAYNRLGKYEEAEFCIVRSYELDSMNAIAASNVGFFYQQREQYEKSLIYLNRAIELNPYNFPGYNNRGYTKMMLGDLDGAMEDVERSMELQPNNNYAYRNRALIYIEMGDYKKACEDMEEAIGLGYSTTYGDELEKLQLRYCN